MGAKPLYQMSEAVHQKTQSLIDEKNRDNLTGIWNRLKLVENLSESIDNLGEDNKVAILFIDINDFKKINDSYGHDVGDEILIEVSQQLKSSIRSNDSVYRLGGDEFIVIINNVKINSSIDLVVNHLLDKFKQPLLINGNNITIQLSIGIAIAPDNSSSVDELLRQSDIAMYKAKKDKYADYVFFERAILNKDDLNGNI
jgi:diguanylate cyclase (GGDEF)-like protein